MEAPDKVLDGITMLLLGILAEASTLVHSVSCVRPRAVFKEVKLADYAAVMEAVVEWFPVFVLLKYFRWLSRYWWIAFRFAYSDVFDNLIYQVWLC